MNAERAAGSYSDNTQFNIIYIMRSLIRLIGKLALRLCGNFGSYDRRNPALRYGRRTSDGRMVFALYDFIIKELRMVKNSQHFSNLLKLHRFIASEHKV